MFGLAGQMHSQAFVQKLVTGHNCHYSQMVPSAPVCTSNPGPSGRGGGRGGGGRGGGGRGGGPGRSPPYRPPTQRPSPPSQTFQRPAPPQQQDSGFQTSQGARGGGGRGRGGRGLYSNNRDDSDSVLVNEQIDAREVRLLGTDKSMLGVMLLDDALDLADEQGVDVVLVSPDASPPVARLVDYSKYKYELAKAAKEQSKKQREARQDLKELKLRPGTDMHDYQVRLRAAQKFIQKGDKVKLTLVFKGREMEFKNIGEELMSRFVADVGDEAVVTAAPSMQGRMMSMILGPKKAKAAGAQSPLSVIAS